jgi:hypothetical protein
MESPLPTDIPLWAFTSALASSSFCSKLFMTLNGCRLQAWLYHPPWTFTSACNTGRDLSECRRAPVMLRVCLGDFPSAHLGNVEINTPHILAFGCYPMGGQHSKCRNTVDELSAGANCHLGYTLFRNSNLASMWSLPCSSVYSQCRFRPLSS